MRWFRSNWLYVVLALGVAFAVHVASVAFLPQLIMTRALAKMSSLQGYNAMTHSPRATSASRAVVRPSPDLLYSACPYDLSQRPLRVRVAGMPHTYWSVSLFDAETNNFFALNNSQATTGSAEIAIVPPTQDKSPTIRTVRSPTVRGLVLVRTLIADEKNLAAIDKARRSATCAPY